jgi:predicted DNA-binding protein (MmcQ/YjbR family)
MNVEEVREYCMSKKGSSEEFPFDDVSLVIKAGEKMFALISLDEQPLRISLKCNPDYALELREQYSAVQPAYHFNKKYWNMIILDGSISDKNLKHWIDHSYEMVLKGMTKKQREEIK